MNSKRLGRTSFFSFFIEKSLQLDTNVLEANLKPRFSVLWPRWQRSYPKSTIKNDSIYFMVDLGVKPVTNVAIVPHIEASSQLLPHLYFLYLTFIIIAMFHKHCAFTTSYVLFGTLACLLAMPCLYSCPWLLAIRLTISYGRFRDKARYQRGHNALYRGFKLATSTFVLSTLDVYLYSHILQALRFYYISNLIYIN